ncbi:MAG: serine protein kinase, partial [Phycisphaerae bacterium]
MPESNSLLKMVTGRLDQERFRQQHWEGSFQDYLEICTKNPKAARNAFQRVYDMILSYGFERYTQFKHEAIRYHFFADPIENGQDAVFGLDPAMAHLVDIFKSAAQGLGTEKRILLLHGPVGSAKSTIARLLKKGLEAYSKTEAGALYTFAWRNERFGEDGETQEYMPCPMHEEPLLLIPIEARKDVIAELNKSLPEDRRIRLYGDVCPFCRKTFDDLLIRYAGDWSRVIEHVRVRRLILSEKDRRGIGTFQPKDEKNQ